MQIVILAAGRGTRMGELTKDVPKPMLKINSKPILAHKIDALPSEIDEVIFVIGYLGNKIREYFGESYGGRKISYFVQEELNGTGGAVHLAKDLIEDEFLVMMGDDLYMKDDIIRMLKCDLAILGMDVSNPEKFGVITLDDNGNLKETVENLGVCGIALINTGLYKLNKNFFTYPLVQLSGRSEFGLPQGLALMAKDFQVKVEKATDWFPIGNPEDFEKAQEIIGKFV